MLFVNNYSKVFSGGFTMIDNYNESKWDKFELTGKINDYLEYKGIPTKFYSDIKGAYVDENGKGSSNIKT